ncbi:MAG: hypothetical protein CTY34_09200 [Methylobacter sp.]|nr:MAG: hypothetical protein CTY34_09200 [Methylobacter sp.]PPD23635.1 MAG: hypothetical protein CTY24_03680 [Methylobacter sp.]PPD37476.1 MAG: hypothetical protein CTY18_00700 [Methylomonas sp.]
MSKNQVFFSLKWKLGIVMGLIFLVLHSLFSYLIYRESLNGFYSEHRINQAQVSDNLITLIKDSFFSLDQITQLALMINEPVAGSDLTALNPEIEKHWGQWQLNWNIENISLYNAQANTVASLGPQWNVSVPTVEDALQEAATKHNFFCADNCYQQIIAPFPDKKGALSITKSFSTTIAKYRRLTGLDIGVLQVSETPAVGWPYKLLSINQAEKNTTLYNHIIKNYLPDNFLQDPQFVNLSGRLFVISMLPYPAESMEKTIFLLLIDDVSTELQFFTNNLSRLWFYSITGLSAALIISILVIQAIFNRIHNLSLALPLLSKRLYHDFKNTLKNNQLFGYDEINQLSDNALNLSEQLASLERQICSNNVILLEKSEALVKERNFVRLLLESSPILILTQKTNGMVTSVNQFALTVLETDSESLVGKVFDTFLPAHDQNHPLQLAMIRSGLTNKVRVEGEIQLDSGRKINILWLHVAPKPAMLNNTALILTFGIPVDKNAIFNPGLISEV